ncbi:DegT/DnrJ/EryC1/StrS family aminotransferase [Brevibacillus fulvus]|uniref:Pyridoxal phosphate-dependent aminotransferase EpsN n=1 Tax=Brevibacillus fulvus TaxID=1125967 RepID=A0A938XYS2_9BACL|nr:aminotransferase class I/II-fold pyridoxal phosphate-dependent enzyme [Brevibacillus fulvus]MBM7588906.1 pyridoxal phosphate-dependent aminotransferase EpsN [Brevibacillus fulvus]
MSVTNERIFLSPPHLGEEERKLLLDAFASNWIAPLGEHVDAFEQEIAERVGARGAVALSSGTAGLHLALRLLGAGPTDTVFCSTLTFVASVNPVLYVGATPVLIDSEPQTWNMSPAALERALQEAAAQNRLPKAVIVVHLYGQSAGMEPINRLCARYEVPVIEDAAEALGATYRGKACGTWGRFGVYSFNGNKIITTSGGGMLVSDDLAALEKARSWAAQAREPVPYYQHSELGYNYRLSNLLAAVGRGQLRVLAERVAARRAIFQRYQAALAKLPGISPMPESADGVSTRWLSVFTIDEAVCGCNAEAVITALALANIEARRVWKPMHQQPLYRECRYYPHDDTLSVSDRLFAQGICLPSGSSLTEAQQTRVIAAVAECLGLKQEGGSHALL